MQVILLQDVDNLGLRGDVVDVARGYARNFLLPRRLAEQATPALVTELGKRDRIRSRHEAATSEQAREIAAVLEQVELRFDVKSGPTGSLFGSVTATDIADRLWEAHKVRVDRRKIDLPQPIKHVGRFSIGVEVFQDVVVEVATIVVPEGGELPAEEPDVAAEPEAEVGGEAAEAERPAIETPDAELEEPAE